MSKNTNKKPIEELAINAGSEVRVFSFKNSKLNDYSLEIAQIADEERERNVKLAKIFGEIKVSKCYEEDGFKSVADYAEKTFSVKRAMAYQLANVGERFYNSESEVAQKVSSLLSPSNLAEIAKLSDDEISEAVNNGEINEESTQAELRSFASSHSPSKTKVAKMFKVNGWATYNDSQIHAFSFDSITFDSIPSELGLDRGEVLTKPFSFVREDESKYTFYVSLAESGELALYQAEEVKQTKKPVVNKPKYTKAELLAMLSELSDTE